MLTNHREIRMFIFFIDVYMEKYVELSESESCRTILLQSKNIVECYDIISEFVDSTK